MRSNRFFAAALVLAVCGCAQQVKINWEPYTSARYRQTAGSVVVVREGDVAALKDAGAVRIGTGSVYHQITPDEFRRRLAVKGGTHALQVARDAGRSCRAVNHGAFGTSSRCHDVTVPVWIVFRVPPENMGDLPEYLRAPALPGGAQGH